MAMAVIAEVTIDTVAEKIFIAGEGSVCVLFKILCWLLGFLF